MMRLRLEWKVLDAGQAALVFDQTTWAAFQMVADERGVDTGGMIVEALTSLLGMIVARRNKD